MDRTPLDVSVILVNWNTRDLILDCIASLPSALGTLRADVWLVDNASSDDSVAAVREQHAAVKLIVNDRNVGFAAACNQAIMASTGRYVLVLNSDTVAHPGSIQHLVEFADARPQAALVGPGLLNTDGSFQASFSDFPTLRNELLNITGVGKRLFFRDYPGYGPRHAQAARRVNCVVGPAMLVRRSVLPQAGLMDEGYFLYSEEVDWCLRIARAGGEIWFTPDAQIVHHGGQSTRLVRFEMLKTLYRSKVRFFRKHYGPVPATVLRVVIVIVLRARWFLARLQARRSKGDIAPAIRWRDLESPPPAD